jgi:Glyoxalase-like domain
VTGVASRITSWCIDCTDPELLASFWCAVLGWQVTARDGNGVRVQGDSDAVAIDLFAVPVEPSS